MKIALLAIGLTLAASPAVGQASAENGERIAQRACGGCHAVRGSRSPLPDAPPFARLHARYRQGGLDALLDEGMLAPPQPPEEGSPRTHPRMPMARLDDDQRADLKAYLKSLEPKR
ncbi:cytochrome c [Caulobacter segnis]|uniref:Cytochrome C n=1 Tax=Caulobacter segnis TaxID=88688 RepID=A0A2W5VQ20_9CAUL|nr:cytochrome c [Caulobacter segnis]PZR37415.1 MAG: cytochrome C [Caulobacter segnis]